MPIKIIEATSGTDLKSFSVGSEKIGTTTLVNSSGVEIFPLSDTRSENVYATTFQVTPPATPTDIITIVGSSTKTIRVKYIYINTIQTTAGINQFFLIKRSTDNTGGTSTNSTIVPNSSLFPSPTCTIRQYTANPTTLGTSVGNIRNMMIVSPAVASLINGIIEIDLTNKGNHNGIDLIGLSQVLSINFGGAALPAGLSVRGSIVFSEL
jgi:hypothetical protein